MSKDINTVFEVEQFSLDRENKREILLPLFNQLHLHHYDHSEDYRRLTEKLFNNRKTINSIEELPFFPVNAFKNYPLKSIPDENIYKIITSSGTSQSVPSKIYLDSETAQLQVKALSKIITKVMGKDRLPMLIIDSKIVLKDRTSFSARGAGILGLSVFGKDHTYLLDEKYEIDYEAIKNFMAKYNGKKILIFGFTFMVWEFLFNAKFDFDIDLSNAILFHSGGWKKMLSMAVTNEKFKSELEEKFGLKEVYNFYGMAEQVGSVYLENSEGYLHCPNYSDIIIRNPLDYSVQKNGEEGLIQVVSVLPKSYPGHSILTDDIGICVGGDDSISGWQGNYFKILGRIKKAELRGCSDTFLTN